MPAICPITLEAPKIPVITDDGYTYEFTAIVQHLIKNPHDPFDPSTRGSVRSLTLTHALIHKPLTLTVDEKTEVVQCYIQLCKDCPEIAISTIGRYFGIPSSLFRAAFEGNIVALRAYLTDPDVCPNKANSNGVTPLCAAAAKGHLRIVKALLADGRIDPNQANSNGVTALFTAAAKGHLRIVKALLAHERIDPNQANNYGLTPLYIASQKGYLFIVEALLADERLIPSQATKNGENPLYIAYHKNYPSIVKALLADKRISLSGIDVAHKITPLHLVNQNDHLSVEGKFKMPVTTNNGFTYEFATIAQHLLKTLAEPFNEMPINRLTLTRALTDSDRTSFTSEETKEVVQLYITLHGRYPNLIMSTIAQHFHIPTFLYAVANNNITFVESYLANSSINPNRVNIFGDTPLCIAAQNGHLPIVKALLADERVLPNQANLFSETPLYIAAQNGHLSIVKALLADERVLPNQANLFGETPLYIATQDGYLSIVEALLADERVLPNQASDDGETPLSIAITRHYSDVVEADERVFLNQLRNNILSYLTPRTLTLTFLMMWIITAALRNDRYNPIKNSSTKDILLEPNISKLLEPCNESQTRSSVFITIPREQYNLSTRFPHIFTPEEVQEKISNIWEVDESAGFLPSSTSDFVHITHNETHQLWDAVSENNISAVKILLADSHINPNQANMHGQTPLYIAAQNGYLLTVEALLADKRVLANTNDMIPLHIATQNGHFSIVDLLLNYYLHQMILNPQAMQAEFIKNHALFNALYQYRDTLWVRLSNPAHLNLPLDEHTVLLNTILNSRHESNAILRHPLYNLFATKSGFRLFFARNTILDQIQLNLDKVSGLHSTKNDFK